MPNFVFIFGTVNTADYFLHLYKTYDYKGM